MSEYRKTVDKLNEQVQEDDRLSCMRCRTLTPKETLAQYGAMCFNCYEAYCREPQSSPDVGDKRIDERSWAYALQRRETMGERLTYTQRQMWRAALQWLRVEASIREEQPRSER